MSVQQHPYRQQLAEIRDIVFMRDNGTCRNCGQQGDRLDNHLFMEYIGADDTFGLSSLGWRVCCELCMAEMRLTERAERTQWQAEQDATRPSPTARDGAAKGSPYLRRGRG